MAHEQTRVGTVMHPSVFSRGDTPALIGMRIHLAEREGWKGILMGPVFINYAYTKNGCVIQFEDHRRDCEYSCHFFLKELAKKQFEGSCPLLLADFAHQLGVSAELLLHEALVHTQGMQ